MSPTPAGAMVAPASTLAERHDHLLPTVPALQPLFPEAALRRGSIVGITGTGATSLTLALLAAPNTAGAWCAAVGLESLGLLAADGMGVDLARFALVPDPGRDWPTIVAALLDAFEAVALRAPTRPDSRTQRRLRARVRERRRVLLVLAGEGAPGSGWGCDLTLTGTAGVWEGLGWGAGHLRGRQLQVRAEGRRLTGRHRRVGVWLPDPGGGVTPLRSLAAPIPLHPDRARGENA